MNFGVKRGKEFRILERRFQYRFLFVIVNFFICSERFLVSIGKSDSTLKVNQPQKIENSFCVFTVSM